MWAQRPSASTRHFSAIRCQFRMAATMRKGTSATLGTGQVKSRCAMADPSAAIEAAPTVSCDSRVANNAPRDATHKGISPYTQAIGIGRLKPSRLDRKDAFDLD